MAIAGLATYQSFSMNYSVRRDSKDSDSGDGGNFMNQMLTFHKKDTATVQDKDGKDVSADKEAASELRFGGIQGMSPVGKYGELKPYTRCITANIKTKEMIAHENNGQMVYSYQEEDKDAVEPKVTVTPLNGMGTLSVGNMRYVMTASEVFKPGSSDAIVRVHVGDQDIDVNINEVDPKHASAVEMFAYCQYADAHDTGTEYTFGSYSVLNGIIDPLKKTGYASLDDAISKKSNWSETISSSKVSFTKEYTKEKYDSSVLFKMLKETGSLFTSRDMVDNEINKTELGLVSMDANGIRYSNNETNEIEWEIEFLNDKEYERVQMIMDWVFQNNISSELIKDKEKWSDFLSDKLSEASFKGWIQNGSIEDSEEIPKETEAERTKRLIQEYWDNGKIKKAMDGYEFMKMQGEIIERNIEKLRKNQKTTRERLLEQDPNAASKWYMYDNGSKRYTFDEFCKFMDAKDAEARANAPEFKNWYLEMASYYLNQRKRDA